MDADSILTTLKLLIIGESGVGKSSLLLRFTDDAFDPEQAATIGVDFKVKTVNVNASKVTIHSNKRRGWNKLIYPQNDIGKSFHFYMYYYHR